jgi:uncharacterized protein YecE (DUF72 family)
MPQTLMAVEFRNAYWSAEKRLDETLDWLAGRGIIYTCVDEPQTSERASAPPLYATTRRDVALLRLHGRNTEFWETPGVGVEQRFQYDYSADELKTDILPNVEYLSTSADKTYVMFNNIHNGHGVSNAQLLLSAVRAAAMTEL